MKVWEAQYASAEIRSGYILPGEMSSGIDREKRIVCGSNQVVWYYDVMNREDSGCLWIWKVTVWRDITKTVI